MAYRTEYGVQTPLPILGESNLAAWDRLPDRHRDERLVVVHVSSVVCDSLTAEMRGIQ